MISLFSPPEPHCGHLDTIFDFNGFFFLQRLAEPQEGLWEAGPSGEHQLLVSNFVFENIIIILFNVSFYFIQFQVRRRIILEPGKKDVEIIVNQVEELVSDVDHLN